MSSLQEMNQKIVPPGQTFQPVTLPNDTKIRTGTVATLLHNIRVYDQSSDEAEETKLEREMKAAILLLKRLGMFDLFTLEEWQHGNSAGKRFVGEQAGKMGS